MTFLQPDISRRGWAIGESAVRELEEEELGVKGCA